MSPATIVTPAGVPGSTLPQRMPVSFPFLACLPVDPGTSAGVTACGGARVGNMR
jgi:hypothetical protein